MKLEFKSNHGNSAQLSEIKATQTPGNPIELSLNVGTDEHEKSMVERCLSTSEIKATQV